MIISLVLLGLQLIQLVLSFLPLLLEAWLEFVKNDIVYWIGPAWDENVPIVVNPSKPSEINRFSCSLCRLSKPLCSCVIVSRTFVLSPCDKCLRSKNKVYIPEDFEVQYGFFDRNYVGNTMEIVSHSVKRLLRHPECYNMHNEYSAEYDIAVIQIEGNVELSPTYFAKLPKNHKFTFDTTKYAYLSNFRIFNLLAVERHESVWMVLTKVIDGTFCLRMLRLYKIKNICAAYHHVAAASKECQTDIGASLSVKPDINEEVLIGLLINKRLCGRARSVAGFVNIRLHVKWIRQLVQRYSNGRELV
ncbi:hypothetical protein ILUMI_05591 [Ignelater luminosus]|uniref:Peptidase S1 domain-containing protein n=1 Tax=Ignelater luminosus TaxID=2038154 RepID=A0A8K0GG82_IGNLU|nr:hypothetical protein ILUMI_05591 [Ignelater luminosus]